MMVVSVIMESISWLVLLVTEKTLSNGQHAAVTVFRNFSR